MCRDTIRAGWRNITACSGPNCASSAGCIGSPRPSAARRPPTTARSRPGPSRPRPSDWQTRTGYDFLRFEDLIQRDLAAPIWRTVLQAIWIYWRLVFRGTIARFWKANWRFATFITYPHLMLLAEALVLLGVAFAFAKGLGALGVPDLFGIAAAVAVFVALLGTVLKYTENHTYLLYLLSDTIWTWQFSHRQRPEWDERIDRFAQHLVKSRARERRRGNRRRRPQLGIVSGRRDPGARAETRSRARAARSAHRAADHRRQFPDRRISTRPRRISAIIFACWRSSPRSTGSTASRART